MKRIVLSLLCAVITMQMTAQKIDLNKVNTGQEASVQEPGCVQWDINKIASDTKTLENGVVITIAAAGNATILKGDWHKNTCQWGKNNGYTGNRFLGDGAIAYIATKDPEGLIEDPAGGETPNQTKKPTSISVTISGLTEGHHSVAAYHVWKDPKKTDMPTIKVEVVRTDIVETIKVVDGEEVIERTKVETTLPGKSGVEFVNVKEKEGELKMSDATYSYVEFDITQSGQSITLTYTTEVEEGKVYQTTNVILNGLLIDRSPVQAMDPTPNHQDFHVDGDDGSVTLGWAGAAVAVKHKLVWGSDADEVAKSKSYQYEGAEASYTISGLKSGKTYYWRVDEEIADGRVFEGNVWSFRPRQLAFPEAEGYGRFAQGGRVYASGNIMEGNEEVTRDNWNGGIQTAAKDGKMDDTEWALMRSNEPFEMAPVTIMGAEKAFDWVLSNAGATVPCRDIVDERICEEVRTGQAYYVKDYEKQLAKIEKKTGVKQNPYGDMWGLHEKSQNEQGFFKYRRLPQDSYKQGIITDPRQMGGYPEYRAWEPYVDSDNDGMPDAWEKANGLNPNDASDAVKDCNGDGYTNIEKYINAIPTGSKIDWRNLNNNYDTLAAQGKLM